MKQHREYIENRNKCTINQFHLPAHDNKTDQQDKQDLRNLHHSGYAISKIGMMPALNLTEFLFLII